MIREVKERLAETGSIYMIEFPGLSVADISELRANVIDAGEIGRASCRERV